MGQGRGNGSRQLLLKAIWTDKRSEALSPLVNSVNEFVREDRSQNQNVFLKGVQYNPLTGRSGWVGGWKRAVCLILQYFFIFLQGKMNSDTGQN